ncbi:MAG: hypothetical protein CMJ99_03020 [Planctomycetes bacterium]|nr:hypothetical protein [Planctomycetota bacterium]
MKPFQLGLRPLFFFFCVFTVLLSVDFVSAQGLLITEFQAFNESTIQDEDNEYTDWIEIFNSGEDAVNLNGYYLTDSVEELSKWQFPAVTLQPGRFLVVFASGKDRRNPASELHTNFSIERNGGEILVLITPDGSSVVSGYTEIPEQIEDASYGMATDSVFTDPIGEGAALRAFVPQNDLLGDTWRSFDFDDSGWSESTSGVGFEGRPPGYQALLGTDLLEQMYRVNPTAYIRYEFQVENPADLDLLSLDMRYDDGFSAFINGELVASDNSPSAASLTWNSEASSSHSDRLAVEYIEFDISDAISSLRVGRNVLAIHGLNTSPTSNDFLIYPRLQTVEVGDIQPDLRQYFDAPSPGAPNNQGFAEVAEKPSFSRESGAYTGSPTVELSTEVENAVIRYTTDGSVPDETSTLYSEPIVVTGAIEVIARSFEDGKLPSPAKRESYLLLHANVSNFSSNIPVVLVNTFGRQIGENWTEGYALIVEPGENGRLRLTDEPHYMGKTAFKRRGSSTGGRQKLTFNFEARNSEGDDKDVEIFGFPEESDYVMYGPYNFDRALMRNALMYELSNQSGRWAARPRFVECYLHTRAGPISSASYWGVYVFMEKIKRNSGRVDIAKLTQQDNAEPDVSGGYIMKIDRLDPGDAGLSGAGGQRLGWVEPKEREQTAQQATWLRNFCNRMRTALNANTVIANGGEYIDAGSWIDHHILNIYPKNVDAFRLSGYMFKDRGGPMQMGPIWDFDRTMGCADDGRAADPRSWANSGGDGGTRYFQFGWYSPLFGNQPPVGDSAWARAYRQRWNELRRGPLNNENVMSVIDEWGALLNESATRNFSKWGGVRPRFGSFQGEVNHLKTWLTNRGDWMDAQFVDSPYFEPDGGLVESGTQVEILIGTPGASIYYTLDGNDPRSGNRVADTAVLYEAPLTITGNTVINARALFGQSVWSSRTTSTFVTSIPTLSVTEIMYNPLEPTLEEDPNDEHSKTNMEFIELKNIGDEEISLAGIRFGRGVIFDFSDALVDTLAPGQVAVVVNEPDAFIARYGEDIPILGEYRGSMSDRSETIQLLGPLGQPIFEFVYTETWHPSTDGQGYSLVNVSSDAPVDTLGEAASWRPSALLLGTPGVHGEEVPQPQGGLQLGGDVDQDGGLSITDAVVLLQFLFQANGIELPCGENGLEDAGNAALLDSDGSGLVNITDAVNLLSFLFQGGGPPALGLECVRIEGCPDACVAEE